MRSKIALRRCFFHIQYLASESLGVRSLALKVTTADISLLLDPSCALGPVPNYPTPHPFEYIALHQRTQAIIDECADARLIAISHYHHDHFKPRIIEQEYIGTNPTIFKQIFQGKMVFGKHPTENIGTNQRERAREFQHHLKGVKGTFVPSDGRTFQFGNTSLWFSPPLPHGAPGTRLGNIIGTCIKDSESCFCFCPDVQGPTVPETADWILKQEPQILVIGGPPLYLSPPKFVGEQEFYLMIDSLALNIKKIVIDHHLLRHNAGIVVFQKLKTKLKKNGCTLTNFAEENNLKGNYLEAWRERLYSDYPPNEQFLRWAHSPKKNREGTPPPISMTLPTINYEKS